MKREILHAQGVASKGTSPEALAASPAVANPRTEIAQGIKASLAAGLGMIPIGIAFGVFVIQSGLPWWVAPALSIFALAGSLELLLVGLIVSATPLATIALTTLLVNFRHVFYAFTFPLHVVKNPIARFYSMYALIDEAYAVTAVRRNDWSARSLLALQISFQTYWVGGGLIGVLLAGALPGKIEGLEFALCALFVTLALDACRTKSQLPSVVMAGASFVIAFVIAPDQVLFLAMLGFILSLCARCMLTLRRTSNA